jgi:hypothetical protein
MEDTISYTERQATAPQSTDYNPPTAYDLGHPFRGTAWDPVKPGSRRAYIRDLIAEYEKRPLRDTLHLSDDTRYVRVGGLSGAVFAIIMAALALGTYLYFKGVM